MRRFISIAWLMFVVWPVSANFPHSHAKMGDALGRLVGVVERDYATNGFNWSATYDALGRRLRTINVPVAHGIMNEGASVMLDSYFDPQVKFSEVAVGINGQRTWKVLGPDITGQYGGMHGVGGVEATIQESDGTIVPVVTDCFGNVLASISMTNITWNPVRVGGYGPVMGYRSPAVEPGIALANTLVWRSRWMDPSGFYCLGARYYDPMAGRFLSPDPMGHAGSMDLYSFCNGDPLNRFDVDGRFGKDISQGINNAYDTLPDVSDKSYSSFINLVPVVGGAKMFYELASGEDMVTGESINGNDVERAVAVVLNLAVAVAPAMELAGEGELFLEAGAGEAGMAAETTMAEQQLEFGFAAKIDATAGSQMSSMVEGTEAASEMAAARGNRVGNQLELNYYGSAADTGLFRVGEAGTQGLPQTMETVLQHAEQGGIGLDGINVKIIPDAPPNFYGWANPNGTEIHLYPAAFTDSESLITTLGHERMHAYQFQTFGPAVNASTTSAQLFENAAVQTEGSFYQYFLSNGGGH